MRISTSFLSRALALGLFFSTVANASIIQIGDGAVADNDCNIVIGDFSHNANDGDCASAATVIGPFNNVGTGASGAAVVGTSNTVGNGAIAATVMGSANTIDTGVEHAAILGNANHISANHGVSVGWANVIGPEATDAVTMGTFAKVYAKDGVVLGHNGVVSAGDDNSVAFANTQTTKANELAVGGRQVSQVADGTEDTDAVNLRQLVVVDTRVTDTRNALSGVANWFGGGASYNAQTNAFTGPNYTFISGANFTNVGTALADLDSRLHAIEILPPGGTGTQGPAGPAGQDGSNGSNGTNGQDGVGVDGQDGSNGTNGTDGQDGDSAYQVAVTNGFTGTQEEWLASLHGRDGVDANNRYFKSNGKNDGTDDAKATGTDSLAAGANANAEGDNSSAIGNNAHTTAGATNSVALGNGSVADQANTVSVGSVGYERRVVNVADGRVAQGSTDAINGGQLWDAQQGWNDRWNTINNRVDGLDRRISGVCAMGAAQGQMASSAGANPSNHKVSVGVGFCGGSSAISAGYQQLYRTKAGRIGTFSLGVSASGHDTAVGAGWSMGW